MTSGGEEKGSRITATAVYQCTTKMGFGNDVAYYETSVPHDITLPAKPVPIQTIVALEDEAKKQEATLALAKKYVCNKGFSLSRIFIDPKKCLSNECERVTTALTTRDAEAKEELKSSVPQPAVAASKRQPRPSVNFVKPSEKL